MSENTVGTAYVQIVPSAQGISGSISNLIKPEAERSGTEGGNTLMSAMGNAILGASAVVVAAVASVVASANATAQFGDTIDKTSQKMSIASDRYQALAFAAQHCGFETSVLMTAQRNLSNTNFDGDIYDAVNAVMKLGTAEERTAKATELFGARATQQMQALINGSQSADEFKEQLESLGGMMSDQAVKDSAAYEDALLDMKTAMQGVRNAFATEFLPSMSTIMQGVAKVVSGDGEGFNLITQGLKEFGGGFIDAIKTSITEKIPNLASSASATMDSLASYISANLPTIIQSGLQIVTQLTGSILSNVPQLLASGAKLIVALAQGLLQSVPSIVSSALDICVQIKNAFLNTDWISIGSNIIQGIGSGIANALKGLVDVGLRACRELRDSVKSFFGIHSPSTLMRDEIGRYIPEGIAVGISTNTDSIEKAMDDVNKIMYGSNLNGSYKIESNTPNFDNVLNRMDRLEKAISTMKFVLQINGAEFVAEVLDDIDNQLGNKYMLSARGV